MIAIISSAARTLGKPGALQHRDRRHIVLQGSPVGIPSETIDRNLHRPRTGAGRISLDRALRRGPARQHAVVGTIRPEGLDNTRPVDRLAGPADGDLQPRLVREPPLKAETFRRFAATPCRISNFPPWHCRKRSVAIACDPMSMPMLSYLPWPGSLASAGPSCVWGGQSSG
jgi:hypothetical protein